MKKRILCVVLAVLSAVLSGCNVVQLKSDVGDALSDYNSKAKVTSADMNASAISNTVNVWITNTRSHDGKLPEEDAVIEIGGSGDLTIVAPGFMLNDSDIDGAEAARDLAKLLKDDFNFDKEICAVVFYSDKKVVGCAYSEEADLEFLKSNFTADNFRSGKYNWGGNRDGITGNGSVVGTYPKVFMD